MARHLRDRIALSTAAIALASLAAIAMATSSNAAPPAPAMHDMRMDGAATQSASHTTVVLKHRRVVHVNIHNLAFGPAHLVVSPGTRIVWTNQDGFQHTATNDKGIWDSGPIDPGNTYAVTFKKTGTFSYHCTIHPFMHGTITVHR